MKKGMFKLVLIVVLLLVLRSAAADASFTFRNGVTWDSTKAEMMAAEGVHDGDENVLQNVIYGRLRAALSWERTMGRIILRTSMPMICR